MTTAKKRSVFEPEILFPAIRASFAKLNPRHMVKNPVMFVTEIGALVTTLEILRARSHSESLGFLRRHRAALEMQADLRRVAQGIGVAGLRHDAEGDLHPEKGVVHELVSPPFAGEDDLVGGRAVVVGRDGGRCCDRMRCWRGRSRSRRRGRRVLPDDLPRRLRGVREHDAVEALHGPRVHLVPRPRRARNALRRRPARPAGSVLPSITNDPVPASCICAVMAGSLLKEAL